MKKLAVLLVVVLAASASAESILETFDGTLANWTTTGTSVVVSQVDGVVTGTKYLDVSMSYYSTNKMSRFVRDLTSSYTDASSLWLQFDVIYDATTSTNSWTQTGYMAAMKGSDAKNETNMIGDRLFFAFSTSGDVAGSTRGNRNDIYIYGSTGGSNASSALTPGAAPNLFTFLDDTVTGYRHKFYFDTVANMAYLDTYAINANGSTGALLYENTTAYAAALTDAHTHLSVTQTFAFDEFGLANRTNSTKQIPSQGMIMDNFYISTDNALATDPVPSWLPEPATIALLGLGALVLRRRK